MVKKYFNNALQHTHTHTLVIATDDTLLQSLFILVCTKGFEVLVVIDSENHICLFRSIWSKNGIKRDHLQNLNTTTVLYQAVYTNKEQETDRQRDRESEGERSINDILVLDVLHLLVQWAIGKCVGTIDRFARNLGYEHNIESSMCRNAISTPTIIRVI
jgi:hypothetical protein